MAESSAYGIIISPLTNQGKTMTLDLDENEITGILNVLGQLPTESNAWPLREKIKFQFESQKESPEETPAE
jgi:hypothetical protein